MYWITHHKILVIFLAVVVAGLAWFALSQTSSLPAPSSLITSGASPSDILAGTGTGSSTTPEALSTLSSLTSATLDSSIFSDPAFLSLKDFSTPVVPEPAGRADPFAPLGASAAPTSQTTKGAQIFAPQK